MSNILVLVPVPPAGSVQNLSEQTGFRKVLRKLAGCHDDAFQSAAGNFQSGSAAEALPVCVSGCVQTLRRREDEGLKPVCSLRFCRVAVTLRVI